MGDSIQVVSCADHSSVLFPWTKNRGIISYITGDPLRNVWENLLGSPVNDTTLPLSFKRTALKMGQIKKKSNRKKFPKTRSRNLNFHLISDPDLGSRSISTPMAHCPQFWSGNLVTSSLLDKAECCWRRTDTTTFKEAQGAHGRTVGLLSTQNELSSCLMLLPPTFMSIKSSNKANTNTKISRWRQTSVDFRQTFSHWRSSLVLWSSDYGKRSGKHFFVVLYVQWLLSGHWHS